MALIEDDLDPDLERSFSELAIKMDNFHEDGSCWKMERIMSLRVEVVRCRPLVGSCNLPVVSSPKDLQKTMIPLTGQVNNQCFYRSIAYHFVKVTEFSILQLFISEHINKLHPTDVPVKLRDIERFEKMNKLLSLRINVLYVDGKEVIPIRSSRNLRGKNSINLVLYQCLARGKVVSHYAIIRPRIQKFFSCRAENLEG